MFLYDVETSNNLISSLKKISPDKYTELFLTKDGHFGYETAEKNQIRFEKAGFSVLKHFGMERSWLQSTSVYEKMRHLNSGLGKATSFVSRLFAGRLGTYVNIFLVRIVDCTIGKLLPLKKSRIIISVIKRKS